MKSHNFSISVCSYVCCLKWLIFHVYSQKKIILSNIKFWILKWRHFSFDTYFTWKKLGHCFTWQKYPSLASTLQHCNCKIDACTVAHFQFTDGEKVEWNSTNIIYLRLENAVILPQTSKKCFNVVFVKAKYY